MTRILLENDTGYLVKEDGGYLILESRDLATFHRNITINGDFSIQLSIEGEFEDNKEAKG